MSLWAVNRPVTIVTNVTVTHNTKMQSLSLSDSGKLGKMKATHGEQRTVKVGNPSPYNNHKKEKVTYEMQPS